MLNIILGDPGADSGDKGKSKWTEKYGMKKSKRTARRALGDNVLPDQFQMVAVFWHQSEVRTAATIWNWSGKTLSPGALRAVLYFSSCHIFPTV